MKKEEEKKEEEIHFHIMHSMKGGCGKSTCSLFKALQLAKENVTGPARVLLLDADFRGSAWQPLLFRDGTVAMSETYTKVMDMLGKRSGAASPGKGSKHTIAVPDKYREEDNLSCFVQDIDFPLADLVQKSFSYAREEDPLDPSGYAMNGYLDFILAGTKSKDKAGFFHQNHQGKIAPGIYINRLERLLNFILCFNATMPPDNDRKRKPIGQYRDVVIDMPPGYDEYSDIILNLLRKSVIAMKKNKIMLHYYQVTTEDIGHMALALENIREMVKIKTEYKEFDTVNAILNNPFFPGSQDPADYEKRVEHNISELKNALEQRGKVYRNDYNASFHEYSTITERQWFELEDDALKEQ